MNKKVCELSESKNLSDAEFLCAPLDQNFHLASYFGENKFEYVYSKNLLNQTKFTMKLFL